MRRNIIWFCALFAVMLTAGCGSRAPQAVPKAAQSTKAVPKAPVKPTGIWLSSLQMTSPRIGWALRWTVSPASTQVGYLVPARTTDGARTWTDVTPPAAVAALRNSAGAAVLDALGPARAWLAVTAAHLTEVFGTSDGGRTWTESAPVKAPAPASLLSFTAPRDGWLLASYGGTMGRDPVWLYRTTDAGHRWSLVAATAQTPRSSSEGRGS
jgi:hypothetical protein